MVEGFWNGLVSYREKFKDRIKVVTFNGRCFDLPLLEYAAFRYGCNCGRDYFQSTGPPGMPNEEQQQPPQQQEPFNPAGP